MKITFAEFIDQDIEYDGFHLYIVRRQDSILYIGIAQNIWNRWFSGYRSHMMQVQDGQWIGISSIGQFIADNLPNSRQWEIELFTLDDCISFCETEIERIGFIKDRLDIFALEPIMIHKLNPSMNIIYSRNK